MKKAATAQFLCCVVAASFFIIAITVFVIFYQNPCGILKSLLESTVKEHGYD